MGQIEKGSSLSDVLADLTGGGQGGTCGDVDDTRDGAGDARHGDSANDGAWLHLPPPLTWCAVVDPHDVLRETEITEDMVTRALSEMEPEQPWPFGRPRREGDAGFVARAVRKADVIAFPGGAARATAVEDDGPR